MWWIPKTARQRAVNFESFTGDAATFVRAEVSPAHVVGTVGKFDEDDADILHHRHNHLVKASPAPLSYRAELEFIVLTPLYQLGDALPKAVPISW